MTGYKASSAVQVDGFVLGDGLLNGEGHAETLDAIGDVDDGRLASLDTAEKVAGLVKEEVIAVEVFAAEDLGVGSAESVEADGEAGKVHEDATLIADYLALTGRRGLQVVLMEVNGENTRAERSLHEDGGGVFDVDFEVAPAAAEGVDTAGQAEEGVEVVELVDLGDDDASAEVGAGGIGSAVVLIRVPVGEILADSGTDGEQSAEDAGADDLGESNYTGMEAELVADHADALVGAGEFDELCGAVEGVGDWFFEENIAAGEEAGAGDCEVQTARVANVGDVRFLGESGVEGVEAGDVVHVLNVVLLVGHHDRSYDMGKAANTIGDDFD
jgi:hypothetical protein